MSAVGIRARWVIAISLAALIPVIGSLVFARSLVQQTAERFFVPEIETHLERAHAAYGEWARSIKMVMRAQATVIALDPELQVATAESDGNRIERRLEQLRVGNESLVSLVVRDGAGELLADVRRAKEIDGEREQQLSVVRPIGGPTFHVSADRVHQEVGAREDQPAELEAVFTTARQPFIEFAELGEFIEAYSRLQARRQVDERTYWLAFAALLGFTIIAAVGAAGVLSRSVVRRISRLAGATARVAQGDLSVRVEEVPADEVGELGRAFNRMLQEVEGSRNRIEYLTRLASWQEMARRLAHEIKNPLTPIQLAVQEAHQRLTGLPEAQRRLLDTVLEVVESEVATLRRLVGEFSRFARLPQSRLEDVNLDEFFLELRQEAELTSNSLQVQYGASGVMIDFEAPEEFIMVGLDRQMMRGVIVNLVRNAVQASSGRKQVHISVSARRRGAKVALCVDDDGPGVPEAERERIFEPYVTTKGDGAGLGLAIAKKVVMEHMGSICVESSRLGGALFLIELPLRLQRTPAGRREAHSA